MLDYETRQTAARKAVKGIRALFVVIFAIFGVAFLLIAPNFFGHIHSAVQADRIKCAANLRQIGTGLQLYAASNHGQYPRGTYDPSTADKPTAFTHPNNSTSPLTVGSENPVNDVTVPFFLMLQTGDLTPGVFVCPTSNNSVWKIPASGIAAFNNLPKPEHLSYSINNPYLKSDDPVARDTWWMEDTNASEFKVIAADMNPGTPELLTVTPQSPTNILKKANSPNHAGAGQNVLFGDGHVEWLTTPFHNNTSYHRTQPAIADNFYTHGTGTQQGIMGSSTGIDDAILLPTPYMTSATAAGGGKP